MITETGQGLSVLILTEPEMDWQTFSTWYSFYKNWPFAQIGIMNERNKKMPFAFYQWVKRLKVRINTVNEHVNRENFPLVGKNDDDYRDLNLLFDAGVAETNRVIGSATLFVRPLTMAVDVISQKLLDRFNGENMIKDEHVWFMKDQNNSRLIDDFILKDWRQPLDPTPLCVDANGQHEPACLVSCVKGCGRWIHSAKGCPLSSAAAFATAEMTANEHRVIELWKKMVPLYNAVV